MMLIQQGDTIQAARPGLTGNDTLPGIETDSLASAPLTYPSLFKQVHPVGQIEGKALAADYQPNWVPLLLLLGFILLAWVRVFHGHRLKLMFRAVFARNYANQLIREGNLFGERPSLILFIVYLSVMAMLVYQALNLFDISYPFPSWLMYLYLLGFFTGLWIFKVILVNGLSLLFNTAEHSRFLLANMYLFNLFAGIVLLPLVSMMSFSEPYWFFYISLVIITLVYIIRIFRSAMIGYSIIKFSAFHLILYLCTLEILPMIVLAKILTRNMTL